MVRTGLEVCLEEPPALLRGRRFGLLCNHASVDRRFRSAAELLAQRFPGGLVRLFSPQHGFFGEQQDNMVESPDLRAHGLPVTSLYSTTRQLTPAMLEGLDVLVVDLQDVGCRVYTFVWTLSYCLEACAAAGVPVLVLDRPNPLGGVAVEGAPLLPGFESFVGRAAIPMRHGLTLAELARYLDHALGIGAQVEVVPAQGWRRELLFGDCGLPWVATSPNLPRLEGVMLYPGQVLLEGTTLSEGRGTTLPFEVCGAPFVDPYQLCADLEAERLSGLAIRPLRFEPTFQKWRGESCGGVALHVTEPARLRPYEVTLALLAAVQRRHPREFGWREPPYEYQETGFPIDYICGSSRLREALEAGALADAAVRRELCDAQPERWWQAVQPFLLYA